MKKFQSDKSNERVAAEALTTLKVNRGSPLHKPFDGEIHLSDAEAIDLARWLGRPIDGPRPDAADNGVDPHPAPRKPKGPKKAG